ncbi:MAG: thiamine diphosphokinase [Clostridiales Family XIII bacterium]|jgi:thiamine pyrophosphokinase|nr:thiamine diphosphokinase [Clostridiales Family XIII bacterium]
MNRQQHRGAKENRRCVIITARIEGAIGAALRIRADDFILCADGGYDRATREGITPAAVLGDFDSITAPPRDAPGMRTLVFPAEKDDSDTLLALKYGLDAGFRDFVVVGGLSGRFDHSFANLQTASYCLDRGGRVWLADSMNKATLTDAGVFVLQPEKGFYFSLFAWSESCGGVEIENAKYSVRDLRLTQRFPIGLSNEFKEGPVTIRTESGRLLIVLSRKG